MVSGARVFQALVSCLLLCLPLSAIAVGTDPDPGDYSGPSLSESLRIHPRYTLSNTGYEGQCIAARWHSGDTITSYDNRGNDFVIIIETTVGLVLCYIPRADLNEMWPDRRPEPKAQYRELYLDGLLGAKGETCSRKCTN